MLDKKILNKLISFRKELHKFPELSNNEHQTQKRILKYFEIFKPSKIIKNIGGYGLAFIYDSKIDGPTLLFRADMDALPIKESNSFEYASKNKGVAHLCGHDGHIAVLCGLAHLVDNNPPEKGKVVLLFQPSEETGEGANLVISDKKFSEIVPDYCFSFHNLPGFKKNHVCIKQNIFSSASTGIIINFKGQSSHAAHPEYGNNPDKCIAEVINEFNKISRTPNSYKDFSLVTIIHIKLGEVAFGTTPGEAVLMATLRTYRNDDMKKLKKDIDKIIKKTCIKYNINHSISFKEEFPACYNNDEAYNIVVNAINKNNYKSINLKKPFRWSEDFGHFSLISKAAMFGIGSGVNHPQLHNENYDFPDEIIKIGVLMFYEIYKQISKF